MNEVKVGIIGVGNMGSAHLNCIAEGNIKGMKVTAICDLDESKLKRVQEKYKFIHCFLSVDDFLNQADITAVIIAVPHLLHADFAIKALKKDKHILVEKPIDITVTKANLLNQEAIKSGKVFSVMFNQRTNSLYKKARELVQKGELGDLKRTIWIITNWYRTDSYYKSGGWRASWLGEGGGVLLNQAPHNLDLWQWICGMPTSIRGFCETAKYHNIEVEDDATIYTKYQNGATGIFITSTGEYPGTNRLEISGTKGKLVLENGILKHWKLNIDEREFCHTAKEGFGKIDTEYYEYNKTEETAHKGILQNFTNAILYGEELIANGVEAVSELTISNAAYLSDWLDHKEITLPFDNQLFDRKLKEKQSSSGYLENVIKESIDGHYKERWKVRW